MAKPEDNPSLMRNLGAFFGHIAKAVRTDPAKPARSRHEVKREVEEEQRPGLTLRRTTIEEIEYHGEEEGGREEGRKGGSR